MCGLIIFLILFLFSVNFWCGRFAFIGWCLKFKLDMRKIYRKIVFFLNYKFYLWIEWEEKKFKLPRKQNFVLISSHLKHSMRDLENWGTVKSIEKCEKLLRWTRIWYLRVFFVLFVSKQILILSWTFMCVKNHLLLKGGVEFEFLDPMGSYLKSRMWNTPLVQQF